METKALKKVRALLIRELGAMDNLDTAYMEALQQVITKLEREHNLAALTHNTAGHDGKYRGKLSLRTGKFALDGRSELFDGLYRVVQGDWTVGYFESEADAKAYVAAGNKGAL